MGAVYEAIDERFGEPIALKEIIVEAVKLSQKELILKTFEREAKSLAKARHESIPYVRDYFSEQNRQFLVMELVEGDDLSESLAKRQSPFSVSEILNWMDQLLDTLDYLHSLDPPIIHRDIKPQNLKLNSRQKIKLLDFGIAKNLDVAATLSNHTFIGATLDYSPIEQILRVMDPTFREFILLKHKKEAGIVLEQNTDERCDIYSLGATFYHLLTNIPPVDSPKRAIEIWSGNPDPLKDPSDLNSNIPPAISACLLKAMEIDRDKRYASAVKMQKAIQAARVRENFSAEEKDIKHLQTRAKTVPFNTKLKKNSQSSQPTIPYSSSRERTLQKGENKIFSTKKLFRVLPLIGTLILVIAGIAGGILLRESNRTTSNTSIPAPAVSTATPPTVETENSPTVSTSPATAQTFETDNKENIKKPVKTQKPNVIFPKSEAQIKSTPTKKSASIPVKPKPTQDPNCVFTNSCQ